MPKGFSAAVAKRLWKLVQLIQKKHSRGEIVALLGCTQRNLTADISRLKKQGWNIKFLRGENRYRINFPEVSTVNVKLSQEEFFYASYLVKSLEEEEFSGLEEKLALVCSEETDPIYDCGPAYGAGNLSAEMLDILNKCKNAIFNRQKLAFAYSDQNGSEKIRLVCPYRLIHTPMSWYLVAWCEERQDFRRFKLVRANTLTVMPTQTFVRRKFDLDAFRGDAWWLRYDEKRLATPYRVEVRFFGAAAQSIKEYTLHKSQKIDDSHSGYTTLVCELSYLPEFAAWLLQWLGEFEIIAPAELSELLGRRITEHTNIHSPGTAE